jgi:hypothetical protein
MFLRHLLKRSMMLKLKYFNYCLAWMLIIIPRVSYSQDPEKLLSIYFTEVRTGKFPAIPKPLSLPENAKSTLSLMTPYLQDTMVDVRSKAYTIIHVVGDNSRQPHVREAVVTQLVAACKDNDSGNTGLALDYLTEFKQDEFTPAARDSVRSLFKRKISHFDQLLRIIGFLGLTDLTDVIKPYTQPGIPQSLRWSAIVSLTRMGNFEAANDMMKRVKKLPVNDEIVYKIFPDLAYSRNPEAINYMIEAMKSDDKNCLSANADNEQPIPCGYRVMEQLAPVIENYPLTLDNSGDIKTKDYPTALNTVREWFAKHTNFKIRQDNF